MYCGQIFKRFAILEEVVRIFGCFASKLESFQSVSANSFKHISPKYCGYAFQLTFFLLHMDSITTVQLCARSCSGIKLWICHYMKVAASGTPVQFCVLQNSCFSPPFLSFLHSLLPSLAVLSIDLDGSSSCNFQSCEEMTLPISTAGIQMLWCTY